MRLWEGDISCRVEVGLGAGLIGSGFVTSG